MESQKKSKVIPLFQVEYDRTLCQPLGTVGDISKLFKLLNKNSTKDKRKATKDEQPSRSVSPEPAVRDRDDASSSVVFKTKRSGPTPVSTSKINKRVTLAATDNALAIFEFSTVYPFVYGNNKFKCLVCSEPFLDAVVLRKHTQETHPFNAVKRIYANAIRLNGVLKVDVTEMKCNLCSVRQNSFHDLKVHLKEHEKIENSELLDNLIPFKLVNTEAAYKCALCPETFIKFRILVIHMSVHFSNYSCEVCGSGFMTLRLLKKHLEVHENGNFPCDKCDKVFSTTHKRSLHVRGVHLKLNPRRCPMCPERFNSNYRRTIHLQDVHNQSTRVHKCETCGRAFNLKYHLVCHVRSVHLQERNQQCDVCQQRFCNKETLKRHMVIHTGEKNYKCEFCGMAFLRRKNLRDHLRLHEVT